MARNIFGYKKITRTGKRSNTKYSDSDIRWEKFKIVIWLLLGGLYMYYFIQPHAWFR